MHSVKNLEELRTLLHEEIHSTCEDFTALEPTDSHAIARNQGYYQALWDIDQICRNSLKYRDDCEG